MKAIHPLARLDQPAFKIEFIHKGNPHSFATCVNELSGDRMTWFDNDPPTINQTLREIRKIVEKIKKDSESVTSVIDETNSHTKMKKPQVITEIGTNHFGSPASAKKWYSQTGYLDGLTEEQKTKEIQRKIDEKEIEIGPPHVKPGQTILICNGRYLIHEKYVIPPPPAEESNSGPL